MKKLTTIVRYVLGLALLFFGLNAFFQFMGPPEMAGPAGEFAAALFATGYMFPIVAIIEIIVGLMFIANKYVALGAVLLAPLSINFVLFHIFLDLPSILFALIIAVLNVYMIADNMSKYKPMLKP